MNEQTEADGYRPTPRGGPNVRTDIVDVYIFRERAGEGPAAEFLQLLRAAEPLAGTWHPVMGHVEQGETAVEAALRELREEVGIEAGRGGLLGLWALEQVHPFYIASIDAIVMSPRFVAKVGRAWEPTLNAEHRAHRWVNDASEFMWPGQKLAVREVRDEILDPLSVSRGSLRIL